MWKWVGAIVGMLFAGFFGLIGGFFIGMLIDRAKGNSNGYRRTGASLFEQQQVFFQTLFQLMGRLAKSDGRVSQEEIELAKAVMQRLRLSPEAQRQAQELFNQGKSENFDVDAALNRFNSVVGGGMMRRSLVEVLLLSAYADGYFSLEEKNLMSQICAKLGMSQAEYNSLHEQVKRQAHFHQGYQQQASGKSSPDLLKAAYDVLEVDESMSDAEIKKAYRRLMSQNHPDKLSAQGLPDEMIELAKERTQEIQSAYELIKKSRK
ncbi:DnaJ-like protein DjlA [Marinomonas aquimarina]|uniref:DnaJ-like protein DjlA n=1 Tax=Marinomonas aquimarina TaxID=295068 RepID=A0A1A8TLU6_9GAMM|nr:co-chaperone DjlA [Marinomonas aquimarina]SBS33785.1 DnaJ-like protein DjlA [Marinomonas aquimarina]